MIFQTPMTEQPYTPISQVSKDANNMVVPTTDSKNTKQTAPDTPNAIATLMSYLQIHVLHLT